MRVLFLSDFDLRGSGYLNISIPLCTGLAEKGHELKCLGFGYRGQGHDYPFPIIPAANFQEVWAMLQNLVNLWKFDVFIVALDIPLQEQVLMRIRGREYKYIGIMPIGDLRFVVIELDNGKQIVVFENHIEKVE